MLKQLLTKTLLAAAGLCVGASAWGGVVTLYSQNYETATNASSWGSPNAAGNLTLKTNASKYINFAPGNQNDRTAYTYFYNSGDVYESYKSYTLEFDVLFTAIGTNNASQLAILPDGVNSKSNATVGSYIFALSWAGGKKDLYVNGSSTEKVTINTGNWNHITLEIDGDAGTVKYTVTDKTTSNVLGTNTYNYASGVSYKARGIHFLSGRYNGDTSFDNISITTEVAGDVANDPTIALTGVDGTNRTYLISYTEGETLHYTLPGGSEQTISTGSSYSVTATASGTLSAYTTNGSATSNTINETVVATAITLNAPTYFISAMTETGTRYYPTYNATAVQTDKLLSPTAFISATFNGTDVELPYEVTEAGTLTITASATGYTSASTDVVFTTVPSYMLVNNADFTEINSSNIANKLGPTWTIGEGTTRWTSWNKTGGINAAGESTSDEKYYVASTTDEFPVSIYSDFVKMSTSSTNLIIGWGLGRNNATAVFSLPGADTKGIAQYIESDYGNAEYSRFVTGIIDLPCTTYTCGVIKGVKYYSPLPATVPATVGANGYTTFASPYALDLTNIEGLKAYKATLEGATLKFEALNQTVAAGTGLLLLGETKGGTYNIPIAANGNDVTTAFVGVTTPTAKQSVVDDTYYFVMKKATSESDPLAFAPLSTSAVTIPAGKAYIEVLNSAFPSGARSLNVVFADETTGINTVQGSGSRVNSEIYNLQGQRVVAPKNGLYIVNGKKVIVK